MLIFRIAAIQTNLNFHKKKLCVPYCARSLPPIKVSVLCMLCLFLFPLLPFLLLSFLYCHLSLPSPSLSSFSLLFSPPSSFIPCCLLQGAYAYNYLKTRTGSGRHALVCKGNNWNKPCKGLMLWSKHSVIKRLLLSCIPFNFVELMLPMKKKVLRSSQDVYLGV